MSNVLERYRGISDQEFFRNAVWLRDEMERFLMREKNVPKKYRAIITYPIMGEFELLFQLIRDANGIYTDTPDKVAERKAIQKKAANQIDCIYWKLQHAITLLWQPILRQEEGSASRTRIEKAIDVFSAALLREEELLKRWRDGTHLVRRR